MADEEIMLKENGLVDSNESHVASLFDSDRVGSRDGCWMGSSSVIIRDLRVFPWLTLGPICTRTNTRDGSFPGA